MSDYEDVLRSKVDVAVAEWQTWLEREGGAHDFRALFARKPMLELISQGGDTTWAINLEEMGEKSLAMRLHREKMERFRQEAHPDIGPPLSKEEA